MYKLKKAISIPLSNDGFIDIFKLHTICVEGFCPNRYECLRNKEVSFLILGDICTRGCKFCGVKKGKPLDFSFSEIKYIPEAIKKHGIKYVVITSVTRDDLRDQGADVFMELVNEIRKISPDTMIELLIPDFWGSEEIIKNIASLSVEVIGHNIEMPRSLYSRIRPKSSYDTSIKTLKLLKKYFNGPTKTGFMVGLGEDMNDLRLLIDDIASIGVDWLTIGQYLSPTKNTVSVKKYYKDHEFKELEKYALKKGIKIVQSGFYVRSSYKAHEIYQRYFLPYRQTA